MHDRDMAVIYEHYAPTVYKYLFCLTRDHALSEDLTQETFVQAMKTVHRFRGDCKLSVWLCQIAKRLWYRELRRRKKMSLIPADDSVLISVQDVEADYLSKAACDDFRRLLARLDDSSRLVVYLRLTGELSYQEIADITGKTAVWARVTFYRARQKLAKELSSDE